MPISLAQVSDNLMVSATIVYALAMVGYLAELAWGVRGPRVASEQSADAPATEVPAGVGGSASGTISSGAAPVMPASAEHTSAPGGPTPGGRSLPERVGRSAVSLTVVAFALHLLAVLTRGLAVERVPWGNMYEFSTAASLAAVAVFLFLLRRQPVRYLGGLLMVLVVLTMGTAVTVLYTEAARLLPALQSYWLAIHVSAAVVCAGIFTVTTVASLLYLVAERHDSRERAGVATGGLSRSVRAWASPRTLDRIAYRTVVFGFPLWTFAVIAGAIWAEEAWGRYWGWDQKETWAFITWVCYAGYLHARATAGWRGRAAAIIALVAYAALMYNYVGVNVFGGGLHSYSGL